MSGEAAGGIFIGSAAGGSNPQRLELSRANRHGLIAGATLDDDDNRVYLDEVATSHLSSLPPYDHRRITRDYETSISGLFSAAVERGAAAMSQPVTPPAPQAETTDYYDAPRFEEKRFWGRRRVAREDQPYLTPAEEEIRDEPLPDLPPDLRGR